LATLNINTSEIVAFTAKLERMHRSNLPIAVRETLNTIALKEIKQNSLLKTASKKFDDRSNGSFFRSNSKVVFAKGFNVSQMKAVVGMSTDKKTGKSGQSAKDFEEQESGGSIGGRSFIPLEASRTSNSWNRKPKRAYRIADIKEKIIDSKDNIKGRSDAEKWVLSSIYAGVGGLVIGTKESPDGNRFVFKINKIFREENKTIVAHSKALFAYKKNRSVKVQPTRFMETSTLIGIKKLNSTFVKEAEKRFKTGRL